MIIENPTASLREIAKAAGISPTTAKDVRARLECGEAPAARRRAIRFTEPGRALIRLLDCSSMASKQLDDLLQSVPPHQSTTVIRLARECAGLGQTIADRLAQQSDSDAQSA